ncbi:MAG: Fic family protein [Bacteroidales bacterium]|nr:Fic family protein [Bacteroidales bacterium]
MGLSLFFSCFCCQQDINQALPGCVFHCEIEFIHPFIEGNVRIGRLWQTVMLRQYSPGSNKSGSRGARHDRLTACPDNIAAVVSPDNAC